MFGKRKPSYYDVVREGEPVEETDTLTGYRSARYEYEGEIYRVDRKNKDVKPEKFGDCI